MEHSVRILATIGFSVCAGVIALSLLFLIAGKSIIPATRRANWERANALAQIFSCLSGCIITGTIAAGWTMSHPAATLRIAGPIWLVTFALSLFFLARSRRASSDTPRSNSGSVA
jgi:hypothetical protein